MISFVKQTTTNETYLYLIQYNDMIIGSILWDYDIITKVDININFYDKIRKNLLTNLCNELGIKELEVICDKSFEKYYSDLGFDKKCNVTVGCKSGLILLVYDMR